MSPSSSVWVRSRPGTVTSAVAVLLAWASLAAPCDASVVASLPYVPMAGPVLAGSSVVWADALANSGMTVFVGRPGIQPEAVQSFPPNGSLSEAQGLRPPFTPSYDAYLAASADRIAVEIAAPSYGGGDNSDQAFSGALGASLDALSPVCALATGTIGRSITVDGKVAAYVGPRCDQRTLTDFADSSGSSTALPANSYLFRVSGPFVAFAVGDREHYPSYGTSIEVLDRQTGQPVYAIPASRIAGALEGLDVQSDGKVLFSYVLKSRPRPPWQAIAWASAQEPWPHRLLGMSTIQVGRLVGDRAVILTRPEATPDDGATLRVVTLSGQGRVLATDVRSDFQQETFDFDGSQVTWMSHSCRSAQINLAMLADMPGPTPIPRCKLRFTTPPTRTGAHIRLGVSCRGFSGGCTVVGLTVRSVSAAPNRSVLIAKMSSGAAGYALPFTVRITSAGKAFLRGHHHPRVRVTGYIGDAPLPRNRKAPVNAQRQTVRVALR